MTTAYTIPPAVLPARTGFARQNLSLRPFRPSQPCGPLAWRPKLQAGLVGVALLLSSSMTWATFQTRLGGGARADFTGNGASPSFIDNRLYELDLAAPLGPGAQLGTSVARAGGVILIETSPGVFLERNDHFSVAVGTAKADHGVVRTDALADSNGGVITFVWDSFGNSTQRVWFNKEAYAQVTADTFSSRMILGAPGATGQLTFNGFVEGELRDPGRVFSDPLNGNNRRTNHTEASFLFSAGVTNNIGSNCFVAGSACTGGASRLTFDDVNAGAASLFSYRRNFSLVIDVAAGQELQTWMSLSASASFMSHSQFGNSAHWTDMQISNGLTLDNSDGLLLQNGNSYGVLNTLPVPEPGTWALWLAGLGFIRVLQRRRQCRV